MSGEFLIVLDFLDLDEELNFTVVVASFYQCPALHCAAHSGNVTIVRYILSLGQPVNKLTTDRFTALHIAANEGHLEVVRCLVEAHADVNLKDNGGRTPLYLASRDGHLEVVRCLVEAHADVNAKDNYGHTPLHSAGCNAEIVRLLTDVHDNRSAYRGPPLQRLRTD